MDSIQQALPFETKVRRVFELVRKAHVYCLIRAPPNSTRYRLEQADLTRLCRAVHPQKGMLVSKRYHIVSRSERQSALIDIREQVTDHEE